MRALLVLLVFLPSLAFAGFAGGGATTCLTAGSASIGCINYNGTTQAAGQFDSGAVAPVHTNLLNYDGAFAATALKSGSGASGFTFSSFSGAAAIFNSSLPAQYILYSNGSGDVYINGIAQVQVQIGGALIAIYTSSGAAVTGTLSTSGQVTSNAKNVLSVNDTQAGQAGIAITVTASPFAYTATYGGSVAVGGGTVTGMTLTRNSVVVWSTTLANDMVPVRAGDIVTVTYTTAPTMYQLSD